jgi:hypothetical protein
MKPLYTSFTQHSSLGIYSCCRPYPLTIWAYRFDIFIAPFRSSPLDIYFHLRFRPRRLILTIPRFCNTRVSYFNYYLTKKKKNKKKELNECVFIAGVFFSGVGNFFLFFIFGLRNGIPAFAAVLFRRFWTSSTDGQLAFSWACLHIIPSPLRLINQPALRWPPFLFSPSKV